MPLDATNIAKHIDQIVEVGKIAGRTILELYAPDIAVTHKIDETPITAADLAANKIIISHLNTLNPNLPVLTEETCSIPFSTRSEWNTYWLVDPLDGTREFIKQNGEFSVNIALIHNGFPIAGVVHAPVLDITYWATRGKGAWKMIGDSTPRKIQVRTAPETCVTVARSWAPVGGEPLQYFLRRLGKHKELRMGGALKSCLVAEGRADIYPRLGPTGEWDTAAAQCIVEEAGGHLTDTNMQPLRYNTKDSLLNPHFFVFGAGDQRWSDYLDIAL